MASTSNECGGDHHDAAHDTKYIHSSVWERMDHQLLLGPKAIYLAIGGLNYVFYVFRMKFFTQYYGFPEHVSGLIQTVWNITSLGGVTLWNNIADWLQIHRGLLVAICLGMGVLFEANLLRDYIPASWWPLLATTIFGLYGLLLGGILSLTDYCILHLLKDRFKKSSSLYGRQALFGMVAYGMITLCLGGVLDTFGITVFFRLVPLVAAVAATSIWFLGAAVDAGGRENGDAPGTGDETFLENNDSSASHFSKLEKGGISSRKSTGVGDYLRMLSDRSFLYLIYVILSTGMGRQTLALFLPHFFDKELHLNSWDISLASAGSCGFSLLFYFISPLVLCRLGVWPMLLIAQLALITRLVIYSQMQSGVSRWVIQGIELLNGFSYSFTQVAGVQEAARLAPEGWGAVFQGAYSCAHVQIPAIFVSAIGGFIISGYGSKMLFRLMLIFPLGSAIILMASLIYERFCTRSSKV